MSRTDDVTSHYTQTNLIAAIAAGVEALGKDQATVTVEDLAPVDEFHIGGRAATQAFLDQLSFTPAMRVLDVGCGIGGAARFAATQYGVTVTGVDLTAAYVEAGNELCRWVGLADQIDLQCRNAADLGLPDASMDAAYMLHVGMNIPEKDRVFAEVARVLKPGGCFGVYDVMQIGAGELTFPVPWASEPSTSAVATPAFYAETLAANGFTVTGQRDRHAYAVTFFEQLKAKLEGASGPPPLGLHILMGIDAPVKVRNMIDNIGAGRIAPVEIIARKL